MTSPLESMIVSRAPRVVIVDDDPGVLSALGRLIRSAEPGWEVWSARSGDEALALSEGELIDVLVSDLHMPGMDGFLLLRRFQEFHPETIRFVHSSHTATLRKELLRDLAHNAIQKPTPAAEILALLRSAVRSPGGAQHYAEARCEG